MDGLVLALLGAGVPVLLAILGGMYGYGRLRERMEAVCKRLDLLTSDVRSLLTAINLEREQRVNEDRGLSEHVGALEGDVRVLRAQVTREGEKK